MAKLHKAPIDGLYWSGMPSVADFERYDVDLSQTAVLAVCKKKTDPEVVDLAMAYYHLPIPDGQTYHRDLFEGASRWVCSYLGEKKSVLVHCLYGKNRSSTVVALVGIRAYNLPSATSLDVVRRIRPGAVDNPVLEEGLLSS